MFFDKPLVKVEHVGNDLHVSFEKGTESEGVPNGFYPFPSNLGLEERDKKAILADLSCENAVMNMRGMIEYLFSGKSHRCKCSQRKVGQGM